MFPGIAVAEELLRTRPPARAVFVGSHRQVERSGAGYSITREGLVRGARVNRNHKLWEQYLISYADIAPSHVDWSVDQVEHVLSDELIAEL